MTSPPISVTVWNEFIHEREKEAVASIYPDGIHAAISAGLTASLGASVRVRTATLDMPDHGLDPTTLADTDVLLWWGHMAHDDVEDRIVDQVHARVLSGMGLIVLHSGHASKIFRRLMGTGCMLRWREAAELERVWVVHPHHPLANGIEDEFFELPETEMYGEVFDIPAPDELIFVSWFEGGEVFRSGCTFQRGAGRIFYFRPGHETYPIYYDPHVRQVLANGVRWAAKRESPAGGTYRGEPRHIPASLSPIRKT